MSTAQPHTSGRPSRPPNTPARITDDETESQIASILSTAGSTLTKIRRKAYQWSQSPRNLESNSANANVYETQAFAQFQYIATCIEDYWSPNSGISTREFIQDIDKAKDNLLTIYGDIVFAIGNTGPTKLSSIQEEEEEDGEDCWSVVGEVGSLSAHHRGVGWDEEDNGLEIVMTPVEESTARLVHAIRHPEELRASENSGKTLLERISLAALGFRPSSRNGLQRGPAPIVESRSQRKRDKLKKVLKRRLSFKGKGSLCSFPPAANK